MELPKFQSIQKTTKYSILFGITLKKEKKTIDQFRDRVKFFPETSLQEETFIHDNYLQTFLSPIPEENDNISFKSIKNQNDSKFIIPSIFENNSNREFILNYFSHQPSE